MAIFIFELFLIFSEHVKTDVWKEMSLMTWFFEPAKFSIKNFWKKNSKENVFSGQNILGN